MRRLILLAALLPFLASAQVTRGVQGGGLGANGVNPGAKILLPFSGSGYRFEESASTLAHVWWDGASIQDSKGNAWTGTPPQVAASALPYLSATGGAGPFGTSTNRYVLGAGPDVLDVGDFSACVAFVESTPSALNTLLSNGNNATVGYFLRVTTGTCQALFGNAFIATTNTTAAPGPNVCCFGRNGATGYVKLNGGATASVGASASVDTARQVNLGSGNAGTTPYAGKMVEFIFDAVGYTDAWALAQTQRHFGMLGTKGEVVNVSRNSIGTTVVNGAVWQVPAGIARIEADGLLVEGVRTNYALQGSTPSTGTAVTTPWLALNATVATVAGAPDGGTWANVTTTNIGGAYYQVVTTASATQIVASAWVRADTGTDTVSIQASCQTGTVTACTCGRPDGGACTPRPGVSAAYHCTADTTVDTTPVRFWAAATCSAAATSRAIAFTPGSYNAATGTAYFSDAQLEVGADMTSYIPTTTTSAQRVTEIPSTPWPFTSASRPDPNVWCMRATARPYSGRAWNVSAFQDPLELGPVIQSSSARLFVVTPGGNLSFRHYEDSSGVPTLAAAAAAHGWTDGTLAHSMSGCNMMGLLTARGDGLVLARTDATYSTWPAVWTSSYPTTLYLGAVSSAGSSNGYVRDVRVCNYPGACR